jgi:hypothetical protein
MAETEALTLAPTPLVPSEVQLRSEELSAPRFTPRELRLVQEHLGRSFTQVAADDDSDERLVVLAWLKLRRDGYALTLADMDDVVIAVTTAQEDPTSAPPQTDSPRSATGGA